MKILIPWGFFCFFILFLVFGFIWVFFFFLYSFFLPPATPPPLNTWLSLVSTQSTNWYVALPVLCIWVLVSFFSFWDTYLACKSSVSFYFPFLMFYPSLQCTWRSKHVLTISSWPKWIPFLTEKNPFLLFFLSLFLCCSI